MNHCEEFLQALLQWENKNVVQSMEVQMLCIQVMACRSGAGTAYAPQSYKIFCQMCHIAQKQTLFIRVSELGFIPLSVLSVLFWNEKNNGSYRLGLCE